MHRAYATPSLPADAGTWGELARVAWPLMISQGSLTLMYVTDRMFLTWLSTDALAAAMPAGFLHWTLISLFMGTASYVNAFVAQYDGAGRRERVVASVWQGAYFSLLAGLVLLGFAPWAGRLFAALKHDPAVARLEAEYFSVLCYGAGPMVLSAALAGFFTGRGQTQVVMWVNVAVTVTNVVLDYVLIFGVELTGGRVVLRWGIGGAAIATVIGNVVGCVLYAWLLARQARREGYPVWAVRRFDRELFGRLLRFGLPSGLHWFVDISCWTLFLFLVERLGKGPLAATNLAFNLNSLVFVPLLGLGTAAMTLVGRRIGEGRPTLARRTVWRAALAAEAFTVACAAVYLLAPELVLWPYARRSDPAEFAALHDLVVVLLRYVAAYSFFDCLAVVFGMAIRGAGDTRFAMKFTLAAGLLVLVVPTALATWLVRSIGTFVPWVLVVPTARTTWLEAGIHGPWLAATVFVAVMGLGFLARFQAGRWEQMRVIEATGEIEDPVVAPVDVEEIVPASAE
jgi:MATE family multidrug resistance protein